MAVVRESYASGNVPKTGDTARMLLVKNVLKMIAAKGTANVRNYPNINDTMRTLRAKKTRVEAGLP
jgi:hypothetical protein